MSSDMLVSIDWFISLLDRGYLIPSKLSVISVIKQKSFPGLDFPGLYGFPGLSFPDTRNPGDTTTISMSSDYRIQWLIYLALRSRVFNSVVCLSV